MNILSGKLQALAEAISRLEEAHLSLQTLRDEVAQLHAELGELIKAVASGEPQPASD